MLHKIGKYLISDMKIQNSRYIRTAAVHMNTTATNAYNNFFKELKYAIFNLNFIKLTYAIDTAH